MKLKSILTIILIFQLINVSWAFELKSSKRLFLKKSDLNSVADTPVMSPAIRSYEGQSITLPVVPVKKDPPSDTSSINATAVKNAIYAAVNSAQFNNDISDIKSSMNIVAVSLNDIQKRLKAIEDMYVRLIDHDDSLKSHIDSLKELIAQKKTSNADIALKDLNARLDSILLAIQGLEQEGIQETPISSESETDEGWDKIRDYVNQTTK